MYSPKASLSLSCTQLFSVAISSAVLLLLNIAGNTFDVATELLILSSSTILISVANCSVEMLKSDIETAFSLR